MTSRRFTEWSMGKGVLYNLIFTKWRHCVLQNEVWGGGRGCYITLFSPSDVITFHRHCSTEVSWINWLSSGQKLLNNMYGSVNGTVYDYSVIRWCREYRDTPYVEAAVYHLFRENESIPADFYHWHQSLCSATTMTHSQMDCCRADLIFTLIFKWLWPDLIYRFRVAYPIYTWS